MLVTSQTVTLKNSKHSPALAPNFTISLFDPYLIYQSMYVAKKTHHKETVNKPPNTAILKDLTKKTNVSNCRCVFLTKLYSINVTPNIKSEQKGLRKV
jgi:hypothetical protein